MCSKTPRDIFLFIHLFLKPKTGYSFRWKLLYTFKKTQNEIFTKSNILDVAGNRFVLSWFVGYMAYQHLLGHFMSWSGFRIFNHIGSCIPI